MNFIIEKANENDRDAIADVLKEWNMHHALFQESEAIDLSLFFVAKVGNKIVGVAGYTVIEDYKARTRLLAVYPEFQGSGIGKALQDQRLEAMYNDNIKMVQTRTDRSDTVLWYIKHYDYRKVGILKKEFSHGLLDKQYSTVLELDLSSYMRERESQEQYKQNYIDLNDPYPLASYPPLIINVALTGIVPTKTLSPNVPISTDEIVEDAIRVHDAGASIVHIHARDKSGNHTSDAKAYETIITAIRKVRPELICCATTSGRDSQSFEERSEVLHLKGNAKPDMASLTLGSLNFLSGPSINSLETIQRLALLMKEKDIKPELEIFGSGMVNVAKYLERHNLISGEKYFNIILGNLNTASPTINELALISSVLPDKSIWAAGGLGSFQLPMNMSSIAAGGHVRVGLEDNLYYDSQRLKLATNESLVQRVARLSSELQRDIATPAMTRKMLNITEIR